MIETEYENIMKICKEFYEIFNLEYSFRLGTMPESHLGEISTWEKAEGALKRVLNNSGKKYTVAEGDGAFYGPKIDIVMKDAIGRDWQMGTMQLDFQLPDRFDLGYTDKDGTKKRPVVIHRVIYGSLERFIGVLIEHYAGAFPLWLSPIQVKIIPVRTNHNEYAKKVFELLKENNIRVELDDKDENLGGKVRDAKNNKIPYWVVIGDKEIESGKMTVESRDTGNLGQVSTEEFLKKLLEEVKNKK
jgi:threonyl-tRNA synthetase